MSTSGRAKGPINMFGLMGGDNLKNIFGQQTKRFSITPSFEFDGRVSALAPSGTYEDPVLWEDKAEYEKNSKLYDSLALAGYRGDVDTVNKAIADKANLNIAAPLPIQDGVSKDWVTPLQAAIMAKREEMVRFLLDLPNGAVDVNKVGKQGYTALYYALQLEDETERFLDVLLKFTADVYYTERAAGWNVLHWAVILPKFSEIAPENQSNRVHAAGESSQNIVVDRTARVIQKLAGAGARNANTQDNKGYTPLMMIAKFYEGEDALKLGKMLVEASVVETLKKKASGQALAPVDVALRNCKGHSALRLCVRNEGSLPLFEYLLDLDPTELFKEGIDGVSVMESCFKPEVILSPFIRSVLEKPRHLMSLKIILKLLNYCNEMAVKHGSYKADYLQLAQYVEDMLLGLLDDCEPVEAHCLTMIETPDYNFQTATFSETRKTNSVTVALEVKCISFLAHRHVQNELRNLWVGNTWSDDDERYIRASAMSHVLCPQNVFRASQVFHLIYLTIFVSFTTGDRQIDSRLSITEFMVYFCASGFGLKETSTALRLKTEYFQDTWNLLDSSVVILHFTSFAMRILYHIIQTRRNLIGHIYMVLVAMNVNMSTMRIMVLFNMHPRLGPLQLMLSKMLMDVSQFMLLFAVVLLGFGFGIYNVYKYQESAFPENLSDGLTYLFWATLGEFSVSDFTTKDRFTNIVGQCMFGLFLIMTMIVLVNLLIAMMSATFSAVEDNKDREWKASWAETVQYLLKEHSWAEIPPPLNLIALPSIVFKALMHMVKAPADAVREQCFGQSVTKNKIEPSKDYQAADNDDGIDGQDGFLTNDLPGLPTLSQAANVITCTAHVINELEQDFQDLTQQVSGEDSNKSRTSKDERRTSGDRQRAGSFVPIDDAANTPGNVWRKLKKQKQVGSHMKQNAYSMSKLAATKIFKSMNKNVDNSETVELYAIFRTVALGWEHKQVKKGKNTQENMLALMHEEIKVLRHQQKVLLKFADGNKFNASTKQFDHLSSMTAIGHVDDMRSSWSPSTS